MSKLLAVFGATGQQGGSVIQFVLDDAELSKQYKIRAISRNVDSEKLQQWKGKIDIVQGDVDDRASLEKALTGVDTIFLVTVPDFSSPNGDKEFHGAKLVADVAVEKAVSYFIFSTLPDIRKVTLASGGVRAPHFVAKALFEEYIGALPFKSAFVSLGNYMQNFHQYPWLGPTKQADGSYAIRRHISPKARFPMVETVSDTGKFVGAILASPDKYVGKTFAVATEFMTNDEVAAAVSKATGKKVVYQQCSADEFKQSLPFAGDIMVDTFQAMADTDYWGEGADEFLAWSIANARGKPTTMEEYFRKNPLRLE